MVEWAEANEETLVTWLFRLHSPFIVILEMYSRVDPSQDSCFSGQGDLQLFYTDTVTLINNINILMYYFNILTHLITPLSNLATSISILLNSSTFYLLPVVVGFSHYSLFDR